MKIDGRDDRSHLAPRSGTGSFNAAASRQFACAEARHRVRMCRYRGKGALVGKAGPGMLKPREMQPQLSTAAAVKDGPPQHLISQLLAATREKARWHSRDASPCHIAAQPPASKLALASKRPVFSYRNPARTSIRRTHNHPTHCPSHHKAPPVLRIGPHNIRNHGAPTDEGAC
jgi:hypothetical protein